MLERKSDRKLVAFISHQLFSKGNFSENKIAVEKLAREVYGWGFIPIIPHRITEGFAIDNEQETDREAGIEICKTILKICDILVFDITKISDGVRQELKLCDDEGIPAFEIGYLRTYLNKKGGKNG